MESLWPAWTEHEIEYNWIHSYHYETDRNNMSFVQLGYVMHSLHLMSTVFTMICSRLKCLIRRRISSTSRASIRRRPFRPSLLMSRLETCWGVIPSQVLCYFYLYIFIVFLAIARILSFCHQFVFLFPLLVSSQVVTVIGRRECHNVRLFLRTLFNRRVLSFRCLKLYLLITFSR